jgi:hypothetical protein
VLVRRELSLALLERNAFGRVARGAKAMRRRDVELLLIVMIACGVGAHIGTFAAWMTFR